jgi:ferritin
MNKNLLQELNKQINEELFSSYLYLSMSAYFQGLNLEGFAHWLEIQAKEELEHAMKFYHFLLERQQAPKLLKIEQPAAAWKSPLFAFEEVLKHEQHITARINLLYALSQKEKDYPTEIMLQWFIKEQVEEENNASSILEKLKMLKASPNGLFFLDRQLAARQDD